MSLKLAEVIPLGSGFTVGQPIGQYSRFRKCIGWFWTEEQARPTARRLQETTKFQVYGYKETQEMFALA